MANLFALAHQTDREVDRINGTAPDGMHLRLKSVELEARNLDRFTRDNPQLTTTVELRDWNMSCLTLWPPHSRSNWNGVAVAYAENAGMLSPYHPGDRWSDPQVQAQRRAEIEKEQRQIAAFYEQQTEAQEQRQNREEADRFAKTRGD